MIKFHFVSYSFIFLFGAIIASAQNADSLYKEGLKLKSEKNTSLALEKFKKAYSLKPNYTEALYEIGWCQNDLKKYDESIITLRKVRNYWPLIPKVHFELGYAFDKKGVTDSAIASYNRCIQLKPDYSLVYKQLGYIEYNRNNYTNALKHFEKYELNAKTEITDYLYWFRKGLTCNAIKDYSKAKENLQKSLQYKKTYIDTYLELGFATTKLKQNEEAIGFFKEAIKIDPKSHIPYNGIGEIYRDNIKDYTEATNWYNKSLDVKPKERKACYGIAYCLNSTGKYKDAIPYLRTAIEQEPTYTPAYIELGYTLYKT